VFIVDESSMVGDKESKGDLLQFGSGRLLHDFIRYARLGRPGRPNERRAKIIFVGDPVQLPPIGETLSPALSADYLYSTFGLNCDEFELTQVLRQEAGSAVLDRATVLRDAICAKNFNVMDLSPKAQEIVQVTVVDAVAMVEKAFRAKASSVLITFSNARSLELNHAVRGRLWGDERLDLRTGDLLLVNRNSPTTGLLNGDVVKVLDVASESERRQVRIKGVDRLVELYFRRASLTFRDGDGQPLQVDCTVLENLLSSPERELSPIEQRALLVDFRQRYPSLKPKAAEFRLAIRQDPYFNALQVKYGYAMTCHKAQGGEWDMAVVDFGDGRGQRNEDFFRWTYTAVTRAKKELVTINAPRFDETSSMDWGFTAFKPESEASTRPDVQPAEDPDWNRLSFAQGQEKLFEYHHALRDAWHEHGIAVDRLDHMQYRERYVLRAGQLSCVVEYQYNGKGLVSRFGQGQAGASDSKLLRQALQVMEEIVLPKATSDAELNNPFLVAFLEKVNHALEGSDIRLLSVQRMQYRLRMEFEQECRRAKIDFHYDSAPKWTRVEEVGGPGSSGGLVDQLRERMQGTAN
jgi:hypothetical protein